MNCCPNCNQFICQCHSLEQTIKEQSIPSISQCPDKISTPVFTSPNSSLSKSQLAELLLCMEAANHLLLSLGTNSSPENKRQLQLHLLGLRGAEVIVSTLCKRNIKKITKDTFLEKTAILINAGQNFIQLATDESYLFTLYNRVISLKLVNSLSEQQIQIERLTTNQELVLNFGDYVSKNHDLINHFFGISLDQQLQNYLGRPKQLITDKKRVHGILLSTDKDNIIIKSSRKQLNIRFSDICWIQINNIESIPTHIL